MVATTTGWLYREILAELVPETMSSVWLRTLFHLRKVASKKKQSHGLSLFTLNRFHW